MSPIETMPFTADAFLDTEDAIQSFLDEVEESGDADAIAVAMLIAERARRRIRQRG